MNRDQITALIVKHEGLRNSVYTDTTGNLTIGVGFNLDVPGAENICQAFNLNYLALCNVTETLTTSQAMDILDYQLSKVLLDLQSIFSEWAALPDNAQAVCADLRFNLGSLGFRGFPKFIACVTNGDWPGAVNQLVDSKWYTQVPNRAADDIALLKEIV